jgi:hypothetical protein
MASMIATVQNPQREASARGQIAPDAQMLDQRGELVRSGVSISVSDARMQASRVTRGTRRAHHGHHQRRGLAGAAARSQTRAVANR